MNSRIVNELHAEFERAHAVFGKLAEARSTLDKAREGLTSLRKLGDLVTQDDVIKEAGKLVAHGLSPMAMAKMLSDMPEKGEELQAWLVQHAAGLAQREAQLEPVLAGARHEMGVTALRALFGHEAASSMQPTGSQVPVPGPNPLTPTAASTAGPSTPGTGT